MPDEPDMSKCKLKVGTPVFLIHGGFMNPSTFLFQGEISNMSLRILPKTDQFERGYVCLVMLSNQYGKILASCNPCERVKSMARSLRATGVSVATVDVTFPHINYKDNALILSRRFVDLPHQGDCILIERDVVLSAISELYIKMDYTEVEIAAQKEKEEQQRKMFDSMFSEMFKIRTPR